MFEYLYPKKKFKKQDIDLIYLYFDNGDYLSLYGSEIADVRLKLYDRLIWGGRGACPVAQSGYIKLKIGKINENHESAFLYNAEQYAKDRKSYIENRCVKEGGIKCVSLFDKDNWQNNIYGNIGASADGEFLTLQFYGVAGGGSSDGDKCAIYLNDISKSLIKSINLDFENCEDFTVYNSEIEDIDLRFERELAWGSDELFRKIESGFIKLKLDKDIDFRRTEFLGHHKSKTLKELEKRLCPNSDISTHDICHLYIEYDYSGFGARRVECVEIEDIRSDEQLERVEKLEEEGDGGFEDFIGGYCKKCDDGTYVILFGKNAEEFIKNANAAIKV